MSAAVALRALLASYSPPEVVDHFVDLVRSLPVASKWQLGAAGSSTRSRQPFGWRPGGDLMQKTENGRLCGFLIRSSFQDLRWLRGLDLFKNVRGGS
jgi:hypothetical protein